MTKHLLMADDEPHVLRVLKMALQRAGFSVDTVPHGLAAWEYLQENQVDALITDIDMPRMTGEELCKKLQQEMPQRDFRIFVATSRTELEHREWSRDIDNLVFLEKPLSARKVTNLLNEYFNSQGD